MEVDQTLYTLLHLQKLEKEAYELEEKVTAGKFLDPEQNPTTVLIEMKSVSVDITLEHVCCGSIGFFCTVLHVILRNVE